MNDELRDFNKATFDSLLKENIDKADEYSCFVDDIVFEKLTHYEKEEVLEIMYARDSVIQYRCEADGWSYDDVRAYYNKIIKLHGMIEHAEGYEKGYGEGLHEGGSVGYEYGRNEGE